jgi:hypothetical protein
MDQLKHLVAAHGRLDERDWHWASDGKEPTADELPMGPACLQWLTTLPRLPSWEALGSPSRHVIKYQGCIIKYVAWEGVNEIDTMYRLHLAQLPAVVHLEAIHVTSQYWLIGMRCLPHTLTSLMEDTQWLDQHNRWDLTNQLLVMLDQLHDCGVVHGDIKPDNILFDGHTLFLCDWGLSYPARTLTDHRLCTVDHRPPELLVSLFDNASIAHPAIDVWAMGVVLFRLWTGHRYCHLHEWRKNHLLSVEEQRQRVLRAHQTTMERVREMRSDTHRQLRLFYCNNNLGWIKFAQPCVLRWLPLGIRIILTGMLTPLFRRWTSLDLIQLWTNLTNHETCTSQQVTALPFRLLGFVHPAWTPALDDTQDLALRSFSCVKGREVLDEIPHVIKGEWVSTQLQPFWENDHRSIPLHCTYSQHMAAGTV